MTFNTSEVAVCCCSDSRNSLSSRVFSMAMTACAGEVLDELDVPIGERSDFLAVDDDPTDQLVVLEHGHEQSGPRATQID